MNHPSELIDLVDGSKDENEIENGTNLMGTSISDEASKECIKSNDSDNDSNSGKQNRKRIRPTQTLPSTGLDVLLVGNQTCNAACHTLASAILRCNIDDDDNILHGSRKDEASVLKSRIDVDDVSSMRSCLKARHVQMTESLMLSPNVPSQSHPRADLIVVMVSARDPLCIETLQKSIKLIHRDYFLLGRTSFVLVHTHDKDKYAVAQDCVQSLLHARKVSEGKLQRLCSIFH